MGGVGRGYITRRGQAWNELRASRGRGAGKPETNREQTGNEARAKAGGRQRRRRWGRFWFTLRRSRRDGGRVEPEQEERRRPGENFLRGRPPAGVTPEV